MTELECRCACMPNSILMQKNWPPDCNLSALPFSISLPQNKPLNFFTNYE